MVLVQSTPLMMLGTTKKRLNRRNNDKYKFWHGGRSSPITYIQTLPSSFNNGLLNLFGIRTAQTTPEERSNGDSIANSIFRYIIIESDSKKSDTHTATVGQKIRKNPGH